MTRLEKFAKACAEYILTNDWETRRCFGLDDYDDVEDFAEIAEFQNAYNFTYQNAISHTYDLWNYLWKIGDDDGRKICAEYEDLLIDANTSTLPALNITDWICCIDGNIQDAIREELVSLGLSAEDIENGMCSRLCDLQETINIRKYMLFRS